MYDTSIGQCGLLGTWIAVAGVTGVYPLKVDIEAELTAACSSCATLIMSRRFRCSLPVVARAQVKVNLVGRWAVWRAGGCDAGNARIKRNDHVGDSQACMWVRCRQAGRLRWAVAEGGVGDDGPRRNVSRAVRLPVHLHRMW